MDLIKGKQKDIILLLKDQFFFLIRMMINKWRIWFLNSLVWVRHCFPVVLPLRRALTAEGDNALSSPHTMAQNAVRCVPSRGPSTLPSPMPSPVISVTLEGGASVHYEMCEVSDREGTNWKNNQYFFFLFSKLPFKPREGDMVQERLRGNCGPQSQLPHHLRDVIAILFLFPRIIFSILFPSVFFISLSSKILLLFVLFIQQNLKAAVPALPLFLYFS